MTPFPDTRRLLFATAALAAFAVAANAADADITLSRDKDGKAVVTDFSMRPNTKLSFFVLVKNNVDLKKTLAVEVRDSKGEAVLQREIITLEANATGAVAFKPVAPEPKKDAPKKDEPKLPEAKKEEPKGEPPAGIELKAIKQADNSLAFGFLIRVLEEKNGKITQLAERAVFVPVLAPSAYIADPIVSLTGLPTERGLDATVKANNISEISAESPATVALAFPLQAGLKANALRKGTYSRDIFRPGQEVKLTTSRLPIDMTNGALRFYIDVDGYARAYSYAPDNVIGALDDDSTKNIVKRETKAAVRLIAIDSPKVLALILQAVSHPTENPTVYVQPTKTLRFRVEPENEGAGATLALKIDRSGRHDFADPDEVISLGKPRDEHVWLDLAGPGGSIGVANTVADRIVSVDVSTIRGEHELQAVLTDSAGVKQPATFTYKVVVDDTPPQAEDIKFLSFPKTHVKGTPLPVKLTASDPESPIARVTFILGKAGPEGKFPDDAPKAPGVLKDGVWVASLPIAADKKGLVDISAEVENEAGLKAPATQQITLVDPPKGTIEGTVKRGERSQPDVTVALIDVEGKEKGTTKSGKKGEFKFENVAPGTYRLVAAKADAGAGTRGVTPVQVPENPTKVVEATVTLVRK